MVGAPLVLGALAALVAWGRARAVVISPVYGVYGLRPLGVHLRLAERQNNGGDALTASASGRPAAGAAALIA